MVTQIKQIISVFLLTVFTSLSFGLLAPQPAIAGISLDLSLPQKIGQVVETEFQTIEQQIGYLLSNKQLMRDAQHFWNTTPETFCNAYKDHVRGVDNGAWKVLEKGAGSVWTITQAISSATTAGAGSLAGYAGISSAVSQLGLGGLTTTIAGLLGSSTTGAAATAVVTSAVGGPVVMGLLLTGGTSAAALGTYELAKFSMAQLGSVADSLCLSLGVSRALQSGG